VVTEHAGGTAVAMPSGRVCVVGLGCVLRKQRRRRRWPQAAGRRLHNNALEYRTNDMLAASSGSRMKGCAPLRVPDRMILASARQERCEGIHGALSDDLALNGSESTSGMVPRRGGLWCPESAHASWLAVILHSSRMRGGGSRYGETPASMPDSTAVLCRPCALPWAINPYWVDSATHGAGDASGVVYTCWRDIQKIV